MKTWNRFFLFNHAERNARYRASLPFVEVDRRKEWVSKMIDRLYEQASRSVDVGYNLYVNNKLQPKPDSRKAQIEQLMIQMIGVELPQSGTGWLLWVACK